MNGANHDTFNGRRNSARMRQWLYERSCCIPNTALRRKSEPIASFSASVKRVIRDLKDTLMSRPDGVGLAAPQVNVHQRAAIVRLRAGPSRQGSEAGPPVALINPQIVEARNEQKDSDGCLRFPSLYGRTIRPHYLRVSGLDEQARPFDWVFESFDAVVVHHEIDHLDGVLFIDRIEGLEDLYRVHADGSGHLVRAPVKLPVPLGRE